LSCPYPLPAAESGLDTETEVFLHKFQKVRRGWWKCGWFSIVVVTSEVIMKALCWDCMTAELAVYGDLVLFGGDVMAYAQMCKE